MITTYASTAVEAYLRRNDYSAAPINKKEQAMMVSDDAGTRHIYEQWHTSVVARDIEGLMALYADDAILESPLVWTVLREQDSGLLKGKAAITDFFSAGFRTPENGLGRWYRTGVLHSNGSQLTWEYPRLTPDGDQIDLVEVMDVAGGLIVHHRVYWGWMGFKALAAMSKTTPERGA